MEPRLSDQDFCIHELKVMTAFLEVDIRRIWPKLEMCFIL
jgi:hypothetical protein